MKKKHNKNYNCGHSKIGDVTRNCSNSSTRNFAKNKSTINDNEYEVTSDCTNCKNKRSK